MTFDATAIALVVGSVAAGVVLIVNAIGSNQRETAKALAELNRETAKSLAELTSKTNVIEGHVNSAATRNASIIAAQETQLEMLRTQIAKLETTATLLAQSKAVKSADTVTGQTLAAHDEWERRKQDAVAEGIAENTALTREIRDAVVPKVEP